MTSDYVQESEYYFYLTQLISEPSALDIRAITTLFQHLTEVFCRNQSINYPFLFLSYIQYFKSFLMEKDFDTLPDYQKWNHTIKLIFDTESKLLKVYSLSPAKQSELDMFIIAKNLYTE